MANRIETDEEYYKRRAAEENKLVETDLAEIESIVKSSLLLKAVQDPELLASMIEEGAITLEDWKKFLSEQEASK